MEDCADATTANAKNNIDVTNFFILPILFFLTRLHCRSFFTVHFVLGFLFSCLYGLEHLLGSLWAYFCILLLWGLILPVLVIPLVLIIVLILILVILLLILIILILVVLLLVLILVLVVLILILILVLVVLIVLILLVLLILKHHLRIDIILFGIHISGIQQQCLFKRIHSPFVVLLRKSNVPEIIVIVRLPCGSSGLISNFLHIIPGLIVLLLTIEVAGEVIIGSEGKRILNQSPPVVDFCLLELPFAVFTVSFAHLRLVRLR